MIQALTRAGLRELRLFFAAWQALTGVPVPSWLGVQPDGQARCARYFPLVGAGVGLWGALVMATASLWWPPTVAVLLGMASAAWLTRGWHEGGGAHTCDRLGGSASQARSLMPMQETRLGLHGALGLALLLMLKAAVLIALLSPPDQTVSSGQDGGVHQVLLGWTAMGLIWAQALSRGVLVVLIRVMPCAGDAEHAQAQPWASQVSNAGVMAAVGLTALVALALWLGLDHLGWPWRTWLRAMGWSSLAAVVVVAWVARWLHRRLGGHTVDTLGASQQLSEVATLLAWLAVVHPAAWVQW